MRTRDGRDTTATPTEKWQINHDVSAPRHMHTYTSHHTTTGIRHIRKRVSAAVQGDAESTTGRRGGERALPCWSNAAQCPPPRPSRLSRTAPPARAGVALPRGATQPPWEGSPGGGLTRSPLQACVRGGGGERVFNILALSQTTPPAEQRPGGGGATWKTVSMVWGGAPCDAGPALSAGLSRPTRAGGREIWLDRPGVHAARRGCCHVGTIQWRKCDLHKPDWFVAQTGVPPGAGSAQHLFGAKGVGRLDVAQYTSDAARPATVYPPALVTRHAHPGGPKHACMRHCSVIPGMAGSARTGHADIPVVDSPPTDNSRLHPSYTSPPLSPCCRRGRQHHSGFEKGSQRNAATTMPSARAPGRSVPTREWHRRPWRHRGRPVPPTPAPPDAPGCPTQKHNPPYCGTNASSSLGSPFPARTGELIAPSASTCSAGGVQPSADVRSRCIMSPIWVHTNTGDTNG